MSTSGWPLLPGQHSKLSPVRRYLLILAKAGIATAVIIYLVHTQRLGVARLRVALSDIGDLVGALTLLLILPLILSIRWKLLLRVLRHELVFPKTLGLTYIALFFDTVMPGGTADVIRGYYLDRFLAARDRLSGISTVVVDRFLGLQGLVLLALCAFGLRARTSLVDPRLRPIALGAAGLTVLFLAVFAFLIIEGEPGRAFLVAITKRAKFAGVAVRTYDAFRAYRHNASLLIVGLGLSLISHVLTVGCFVLLGHALGEHHLRFVDYVYLVPIGLFAAQLPVSAGGIGVGHVAFYAAFAIAGSQYGADVFSLFIVIRFISAMPGLFYFFLMGRQVPTHRPQVVVSPGVVLD